MNSSLLKSFFILPIFISIGFILIYYYGYYFRLKYSSITDYDYVETISDSEAQELIEETEIFLELTLNWLKKNYKVF